MIRAFRIVRSELEKSAFDGEGARLHGGRWNSIGRRCIYVASTRSLAALEILAHAREIESLNNRYVVIEASFEKRMVKRLDRSVLPATWRDYKSAPATRQLGDVWLDSKESVVLEVPSVIIPEEWNYLINPEHPQFHKINVGPSSVLQLDQRLLHMRM